MKLKIMSLVVAAGIFLMACHTTYKSTSDNAAYNVTVPAGIRSNFAIAYPDATNVVWNTYDPNNVPIDWDLAGWNTLGPNAYTVTFNMGNDQYYAWYDSNGDLVGTATAVTDYTRLPYAVSDMIHSKYNGYNIDWVGREIVKSKTAYEIKLSQGDQKVKLLVDNNGNVLKEKTVTK
jgi:hypothetical protein